MDVLAAVGELQATVDRVAVIAAGALEACSGGGDEADPVSRAGHRTASTLLAELWAIGLPRARQLCLVGRAITPTRSMHGELLPAAYPAIADAILRSVPEGVDRDAGAAVSVDQAAVIVQELEKIGPGVGVSERLCAEELVVQHIAGLTVAQTRQLAASVRDRVDQDGVEPREDLLRRRRSLTITQTREGLTHLNWYLDPESAGWVLSAIDAYVGAELRRVRFTDPAEVVDPERMPDPRSLAQLRSDAGVEVFRHVAACESERTGPPVTLVVRVGLHELRTGVGGAQIDGVQSPVSVSTVRRMAADARVIPVVLGGAGEVLDLGRARRLFSAQQRLALAERDDGCAWAGCPHPPGYTEAHHIRWWERDAGPTDLSNGVLLCSHHHHRVHADGWQIRVRDNVPWFHPPAHVDPNRRPRRGGRLRMPSAA